nr:MAG TPA: hypothetical protein [Caudoviricetes sp.]
MITIKDLLSLLRFVVNLPQGEDQITNVKTQNSKVI